MAAAHPQPLTLRDREGRAVPVARAQLVPAVVTAPVSASPPPAFRARARGAQSGRVRPGHVRCVQMGDFKKLRVTVKEAKAYSPPLQVFAPNWGQAGGPSHLPCPRSLPGDLLRPVALGPPAHRHRRPP